MLNNIAGPDMIVVLAIVLLLFGPKNLPKLSRSLGESVRELKKGLHGLTDDDSPMQQPSATLNSSQPAPASQPVAAQSTAVAPDAQPAAEPRPYPEPKPDSPAV